MNRQSSIAEIACSHTYAAVSSRVFGLREFFIHEAVSSRVFGLRVFFYLILPTPPLAPAYLRVVCLDEQMTQ